MILRKAFLANLITAALLLTACGGGGSDSSPAPTPNPTPTPTPQPVDMDAEFANYLTDLADGHIIPRYDALLEQATALQQEATAFCAIASPNNQDLTDLRSQWQSTNNSWQAVQWVKVGAVVAENRLFRIQFWPDANDAVTRGVENLLIEPNTVTPEFVATQNVGGQGLPALEYLMYPESSSDSLLTATDRAKRCEVVEAVAGNLVNITTEIRDAWSPNAGNYRDQLISGTGDFTSIQDSVEELVTNWLEHLEIVKDEKMLYPLSTEAPGIIQITEHWRSDVSLSSIETNLRAIKSLYSNDDGHGFDDILITALEQQAIADQMSEAIDQAITDIVAINQSFSSYEDVLNDADGRAQLETVINDLRDVRDVLTTGFIQALDISIGFNSNDGD